MRRIEVFHEKILSPSCPLPSLWFHFRPSCQAACTIDDEEEYAVLAAVLFPNEPDVPDRIKTDLERNAYLASVTVSLNGFHGSSYRLQDETVREKASKETGPIHR